MTDNIDDTTGQQDSNESSTPEYPRTTVRYGKMGFVGEFTYPHKLEFKPGAQLVVLTDRGMEIGYHLPLTLADHPCCVSREKQIAYAEESQADELYRQDNGRILRQATDEDLADLRHIQEHAGERMATCQRFADELELTLKVVDCEQILGGERIVFYFMADERVDFRQLVRRLATEFQTRIEMRQVGARDEARLLADYETCGRECCCKNFLKNLKPITMSMAKRQKTTLDLSKVSGRCGRLKCCLRYEHQTYEELSKTLPRNNSWVRVAAGIGKVIDRQTLCQLVRLKLEDGRFCVVHIDDIEETNIPSPHQKQRRKPEDSPDRDKKSSPPRRQNRKQTQNGEDKPPAQRRESEPPASDEQKTAGQESQDAAEPETSAPENTDASTPPSNSENDNSEQKDSGPRNKGRKGRRGRRSKRGRRKRSKSQDKNNRNSGQE